MRRAVEKAEDDVDFRWASSVAEFGLLLRQSQYAPEASWEQMIARAQNAIHSDPIRAECVQLMVRAKSLSGEFRK